MKDETTKFGGLTFTVTFMDLYRQIGFVARDKDGNEIHTERVQLSKAWDALLDSRWHALHKEPA